MWNLKDYNTDTLNEMMCDCTDAEDYLFCAKIRDELARRQQREQFGKSFKGKLIDALKYTLLALVVILVLSYVFTTVGMFLNSLLKS